MKPFRCWFGCSCKTGSDKEGVWGECVRCHRKYGYVSRETLRRYADRIIAEQEQT